MNGDLLFFLVAALLAIALGIIQFARSDWQDLTALGLAVLSIGVCVWILVA